MGHIGVADNGTAAGAVAKAFRDTIVRAGNLCEREEFWYRIRLAED